MAVTEAELDDIQRDAESTARLVGAPGCAVRQRASATARLVAEVRHLRRAASDLLAVLDGGPTAGHRADTAALRAALGDDEP